MKKIFFSALAALSLVACVQEAVVDTPQGDAIAFENAFVDNATRATSLTADNLTAFRVWGFINNTSGVLFDGTKVTGGGQSWSYDGTKYWIPEQEYYFAALAPVNENGVVNATVSSASGDDAKLGLGTVNFTNDGQTDLIYAQAKQTGVQSGNAPVAFTFKHLLSKVKFTFTTAMNEDFLTAKVTEIKMTAPKTAEINLASETPVWGEYAEEVVLEFGAATAGTELFAIPTTAYDYVIAFKVDIYQEGTEEAILSVEKTATVNALALEMGKAYNFAADINPETLAFEDIVFNVSGVEVWADAATTDLEAEVKLAAQLGGTYTLEEDVTLTTPIEVPAGVDFVLNLNGKTIKNATQSEVFGEGEAIIAYGDLTINGEGTVEGTTMAVWARGNNGAKVTINGGTYKGCAEGFAKGGRSVIYASSGNTIDIYGGTFQALAADKTSYANKTEGVYAAVNVADNNGNINVYGGTFVGQNPAAPGTEPKAWNEAHPNGFVAPYYKSTEDNGVWTVALDAVYTTAELQATINAGQSHINLAPGVTFDGTVYMKSNVTIEGLAGATMHSINLNGASNVTLKNITFDAAGATMAYGGDNKVRFMANIVSRDQSNSSKVAGAQDVVISGCTFTGKFTNGGMAICFSDQTKTGSGNITIEDCTFDTLGSYADIYGYYFGNKNNLVIKGNTFKSANSNPPVYLGRYASSVPVVVKNNHFATVTSLAKAVTLQAHGTSYTVSIDAENNTFAE